MTGAEADVVIVGCGPVGAALGILLEHHGLTSVIVERHRTMYHLPRAVMMDDEVRRALAGVELEKHLAPLFTSLSGAEFVDADFNHLLGFELPDGFVTGLGLPPANAFHQPDLDQLLRTVARERGVPIRLGETVAEVTVAGDGAAAVTAEGHRFEGRWLVACDGAASTVRDLRGIATVDLDFDQEWLVVDVDLHAGAGVDLPRFAQQVCDFDRPATFVPGHAHHMRWEFQLQPGETAADMEARSRVWELLRPWVSPTDGNLVRAVVYRFHAMVADRMREKSLFLAGDAAHQMPPFLGQGLNSGIRDAVNLAWKLAMVSRGQAGDGLLDTYQAERMPHAEGVVEHAADVGRLIDQLAGRADHQVDESSGYGGGRPFPHLRAGMLVGDSPLVGRQLPQPRVDGRLGDHQLSNGFDLVCSDPALRVPPALSALIEAPVLRDGEHLGGHGAVVVRPDRYVAAVANSQEELDRAAEVLSRRL